MYKKALLKNGLKVITCPMPKMQSVALGIWVKIGGRCENKENKGISHYMEHLAFKGNKQYSCRKIKESIEGVGGSLNGFTSEELTCYLVKLPRQYLNLALEILSSMAKSPSLEEEDIEKERTVILEEIKMYKDSPQSYVHELLDKLMWPDNPLGDSITGSFESVSGIKKKDLAAFKEKNYVASNMVISAAGALKHDELTAKIGKIFSRGAAKNNVDTFVPFERKQDKAAFNLLTKETEQTHLAMGFHGFKREHPLKHALGLLHVVMGANMSSRLFNEVREIRGLAYEIGTQIKFFQDTGAFIVHAGIDNAKVLDAIKVILEELDRVKSASINRNEFKRAKEFYIGQLMLALEDTMDHMLWIGESMSSLGKVHTLKEIVDQVKKITPADILKVAGEIFRQDNLSLSVIGPLERDKDKIYNQLRLK